MRLLRSLPALALLSLVLAGCSKEEQDKAPLDRGEASPADTIRYDVQVQGEMPDELHALLLSASQAQKLTDRPPASELVLRRRAADDLAVLQSALQSQGYYDGGVTYDVVRDTPDDSVMPDLEALPLLNKPATHVVYRVEPGTRYVIGGVDVEVENPADGFRTPEVNELGLVAGEPAVAQRVLDAEQVLLKLSREQARPLAALGARSAVIDREKKAMDVTFRVTPGARADFGKIVFAGDGGIRELYLERRVPFTTGQPYSPEQVDERVANDWCRPTCSRPW